MNAQGLQLISIQRPYRIRGAQAVTGVSLKDTAAGLRDQFTGIQETAHSLHRSLPEKRRAAARQLRKSGHRIAAAAVPASRSAAVSRTQAVRGRGIPVYAGIRTLVLVLLFCCTFFTAGLYSRAAAAEAAEDYKYYTDITVGFGEDFMDYAEKYADSRHYPDIRTYLREVCEINNLNYDEDLTNLKVHPGDTLIIPYYSDQARY